MVRTRPIIAFVQLLVFIATARQVRAAYFGKPLGRLSELHHGVSGEVFAVDARTLYLKDFTYDGQGPAAYFYAGSSRSPGNGGFRLKDEKGSAAVIRRYRHEGVTLSLPEGKTLNNIKWFSVWCEEFEVNFGDVKIPRQFDYPRPRKIDALKGVHGISSDNIVIVDAQTLLVPNLSYDGEAPDAKFWVGRGSKPSPQGVRVVDENGKEVPLRRYDRKTVVLTLPGDLTVFDIGHFGIWCEAFTVDFGHIQIPHNLNVPPSLKMLGVSPQSKLNCEVLYDDLAFEVRWAIAGDSIVLQLVAKLEDKEYMSFGISGDEVRSTMVGGDVVVAWVDKETLKGYADDYYLEGKSQCSGPTGSCPDERLEKNTNNIRLLNAAVVNGYSIVTYQRPLKPQDQLDRPIYTNESQPIIWAIGPLNQRTEVSFHSEWTKGDRFVDFGRSPKWNCPKPETEQPIMKVAPLEESKPFQRVEELTEAPPSTPPPSPPTRSRNQQKRRGGTTPRPETIDSVAKDSEKTVSRTRQTERPTTTRGQPIREVPTPAPAPKIKPWDIPPIQCNEPEDGVFYAQMGPTGGKRGYPAITGHVGWGISWYINGLLIPEINIVRGKAYNFVVEGGDDPEVPAKYHPFYITDDPIGGYEYKSDAEREKVKIYAGAKRNADGVFQPTGVGRLCNWIHQGEDEADDFQSFGAYQRTLELKCDHGEPGVIQFTPDENTPDTLYYQCFTHRHLGWKINVLDSCDVETAASEVKPVIVQPDGVKVEEAKKVVSLDDVDLDNGDLDESPSIIVETKVKAPSWMIDASKKEAANSIVETDKKSVVNVTTKEFIPVVEITTTPEPSSTTEAVLVKEVNATILNVTVEESESVIRKDVDALKDVGALDDVEIVKDQLPSESKVPIIVQPRPNYVSPPLYIHNFPTTSFTKASLDKSSPTTASPEIPMDLLSGEIRKEGKQENETLLGSSIQTKSAASNKTNFVLSNLKDPLKKENLGSGKIVLPHSYQSFKLKPQSRYPSEVPIMRIPPNKARPSMMNSQPIYFQDPPLLLSQLKAKLRPQGALIFMKRPPPQMLSGMVPPQINIKSSTPAMVYAQKPMRPQLNVKISSPQASTEREQLAMETTDKPYASPLVHAVPSKVHYNSEPPVKHAVNTGFRPESIVVEGGFRPILSKDIESRMGNIQGPELEYESEIGIIDVRVDQPKKVPFGPVFVPSPAETIKPKYEKLKNLKKRPLKLKRGERKVGSQDDEVAEADERVDSFYLPPDDNHDEPVQHIVQPSNIDIPAGTVVSYDGKPVSGVSLTAKSSEAKIVLDSRLSKAAELVKFFPQFGPFKGELPPLDPKFINTNVPQLYNQGFLSRGLESPSPSYLPQTGKLVLIGQNEDKSEWMRQKREAHHSPEHTAQQMKEKQNSHTDWNQVNEPSSSNIQRFSLGILCANVIFFCIFKHLI